MKISYICDGVNYAVYTRIIEKENSVQPFTCHQGGLKWNYCDINTDQEGIRPKGWTKTTV